MLGPRSTTCLIAMIGVWVPSAIGCRASSTNPGAAAVAAEQDRADDAGPTSKGSIITLPNTMPLLHPGEQLAWQIAVRGVAVGELVIAAGTEGQVDGRSVVVLRSRAASTGALAIIKSVHEEFTTWFELGSARTTYHRSENHVGGSMVEVKFTPDGFDVETVSEGRRDVERQAVPPEAKVLDLNTILFALRAWHPQSTGQRAAATVLHTEYLWQTELVSAGVETIETPYGSFRARRLDGVAHRLDRQFARAKNVNERRYSIWFTQDDERLPVLIVGETEYGDVRIELVDYQVAAVSVAPRTRTL